MEERTIIERFFEAVETLKTDKVIRGFQTFTRRYNLNRRNLQQLRNNPGGHRAMMQCSWLAHLINDYKVNPMWLLSSSTTFYQDGWSAELVRKIYGKNVEKVQEKRKVGRPRKQPVEIQ